MKKAMKVLGILLCAVLLVVGSVAATLAYLKAKSGTVTNTFTVGDVALTLNEAQVNSDGQPLKNGSTTYEEGGETKNVTFDKADRTTSNSYHLVPSKTYTKDPTVTVTTNGDAAYVRMILKVTGANWTQLSGALTGYDPTKWQIVDADATAVAGVYTYEFRYASGAVTGSTTGVKLEPLFTGIDVSTNAKYDLVKTLTNIDVEAHAIQSEGFNTEDAAWVAFDAEYAQANA